MRRILEILRLKHGQGLSLRQISQATWVGVTTVHEVLQRSQSAKIVWPLPEGLTNDALENILCPPKDHGAVRAQPDWAYAYSELRRHKGVTLWLLWLEYRQEHPDGLRYTQFCTNYRAASQSPHLSMRQVHAGGERMTVDYAGLTVPIANRLTEEVEQAQVFVATLCASGLTFCEATWTQTTADFIASHEHAFAFSSSRDRRACRSVATLGQACSIALRYSFTAKGSSRKRSASVRAIEP